MEGWLYEWGSFIEYKVAEIWISRVALFSAEAKRLKLWPIYVIILRNTETITIRFKCLSNCELILLETQEICWEIVIICESYASLDFIHMVREKASVKRR
jgi:hypothetical protein